MILDATTPVHASFHRKRCPRKGGVRGQGVQDMTDHGRTEAGGKGVGVAAKGSGKEGVIRKEAGTAAKAGVNAAEGGQ